MTRPDIVTEEMLDFLDSLRDSGDSNMFGASPHLEGVFNLTHAQALSVLAFWMHTFGDRDVGC